MERRPVGVIGPLAVQGFQARVHIKGPLAQCASVTLEPIGGGPDSHVVRHDGYPLMTMPTQVLGRSLGPSAVINENRSRIQPFGSTVQEDHGCSHCREK